MTATIQKMIGSVAWLASLALLAAIIAGAFG